jgi:hypothetical protein
MHCSPGCPNLQFSSFSILEMRKKMCPVDIASRVVAFPHDIISR